MIDYFQLMLGIVLLILGAFGLNDSARGYTRTRRGGPRLPFAEVYRNPTRAKAVTVGASTAALIVGISQIILAITHH